MLLTRVITAAVLLAVLTLSIYIGPFAFASVMAIAFGATLYEWLRIGGLGPRPALLVAAVEMVVQLSLYWAGALDRMNWFLMLMNGCVMLAWFVIFFAELFHRENGFKVSQRQCLWSAVTFVPAAYLSLLWLFEQGDWVLVLSVLLIVWGADISAYFCGRAWGKHRMAPAISPKKTFEGAIGALRDRDRLLRAHVRLLRAAERLHELPFRQCGLPVGRRRGSRCSLRSRLPATSGSRCSSALSESRTLLTCCPATAASSTAWTPRSPFCLPRPSSCCGSN